MTVSIDPSEVRARPMGRTGPGSTNPVPTPVSSRPRLARPWLRIAALGGLGAVAFGAFSFFAFSFFSGLADPRARAPRPAPMASAWPDLKDGVPAIAKPIEIKTSETKSGPIPAATDTPRPILNLPRTPQADLERTTEAHRDPSPPAEPKLATTAAPAAAPDAESIRVESRQPEAPQAPAPSLRVSRTALPIETAQTIAAAHVHAPIEAPRAISAILPAKTESVRAKAAPSSFVSLPSGADASPEPQNAIAAAEPKTDPVVAAEPRPVVSPAPKPKKPAVMRAAAKPTRQAAREAEASAPDVEAAAPAPAPAAKSSSESDTFDAIPGSREIRYGVKAIGELFTGKTDGE